MQNGTPMEHQYPVTAGTFIIYHLNYSEHITLPARIGKEKINDRKSPDLECNS
mgnify:CR=1 FL=1